MPIAVFPIATAGLLESKYSPQALHRLLPSLHTLTWIQPGDRVIPPRRAPHHVLPPQVNPTLPLLFSQLFFPSSRLPVFCFFLRRHVKHQGFLRRPVRPCW